MQPLLVPQVLEERLQQLARRCEWRQDSSDSDDADDENATKKDEEQVKIIGEFTASFAAVRWQGQRRTFKCRRG
jgi:hypothetical protein